MGTVAGALKGRLAAVVPTLRRLARRRPRDGWRAWFARQALVEAEARSGFFLGPAGLMLGIMAVYGAGLAVSAVGAGAGAFLLLLAGLRLPAPWRAGAVLFGFGLIGIAAANFELGSTRTTILSGEATTRIDGRILWRDRDEKGRQRYRLAVEATERPVLSRPPERATILATSRHAPIAVGARYRGLVRLRPPSGPALPGSYDFAFGAFFTGIGAQGFSLGAPDPAPPGETAPELSVAERLVVLRLWISDRIRTVIGGAEGAVASALITGERSGIPDAINDRLRATGLSHVLSISGLHMALVAGFAMTLVRLGLAAVPSLALRLATKKIAALAALAISAFYLLLSGTDVATTRSFVMIAIVLAAILCDRPALTLRNIAVAATIILLASPHALVTASFQMSFAATAAIVAAYGAVARRDRDPGETPSLAGRALLALVGIAASSLVAGAATAPYAAYHFGRVAPFGLLANMVALPLFSLWIMPLALVSMLAMPFGLDAPFLTLLGHGLTLVFAMAKALAERLPDAPIGRLSITGVGVLTLALLAACFLASRLRLAAVPLALLGLVLLPDRRPLPDLLVFEDGRDVALVAVDGALGTLGTRRTGFVLDQWRRAFGEESPATLRFTCRDLPPPPDRRPLPPPADAVPSPPPVPERPGQTGLLVRVDTPGGPATQAKDTATDRAAEGSNPATGPGSPSLAQRLPARPAPRPPKPLRSCDALTRSGLRVVWTDDPRELGRACDAADVAIVARAIRHDACRSGARLVTLRTLRRSGSLAVFRSPSGTLMIETAIGPVPDPWNRHRLAPWPERWRRSAP